MRDASDVEAYLRRIDYDGPRVPDATTLRGLQRAHRQAVPYENVDIVQGRPIQLAEAALFDKIVVRRRGGFCHELNALFARLLQALGFSVMLLGAERVTLPTGATVPPLGHQMVLVQLEERWLVDVGFGARGSRVPLRLDERSPQADGLNEYRLDDDGNLYTLSLRSGTDWQHLYDFPLTRRRPEDFFRRCQEQQTDPYWSARLICTRTTPDGTVSLNGRRLIVTSGARRQERDLASEAEVVAALREHFGIVLSPSSC